MTTIVFIRHAPVHIDKEKHSTQWQLAEQSHKLCHALAEQIKRYHIGKMYSSTEVKAQLTAKHVAGKLGAIAIETVDNLQETERHSKAFYESQADFREAVRIAMLSPDELLFGDETFTDAKKRFAKQVDQLAQEHEGQTIAIVTHGRVLSMYLGDVMQESPVTIWEKIKMPAYAVMSWEQQNITTIQYAIEV